MNAQSLPFRIIIVILAALVPIGCNAPREFYNILQPTLSKLSNCSSPSDVASCCHDCLGIGDDNYNIMFSIMFIFNAVSLLFVGFLIDKFGNVVVIILSSVAFAGTSLISLGATFHTNSGLSLSLMFTGSALIGTAYHALYVVRDKFVIDWFAGSNLGLGLGISSIINRLSAVATFFCVEPLRQLVGLQWTLRAASCISLVTLFSTLGVVLLDFYGTKQLGLTEVVNQQRAAFKFLKMKSLGIEYWLSVVLYGCVTSGQNTLQDNLTEFVYEKFRFSKEIASISAGGIKFAGLVVAPLSGLLVDRFGRPAITMLVGMLIVVVTMPILAYSMAHPAIASSIIGGDIAMVQLIWTSLVVLSVPKSATATAISIGFCVAASGVAVLHFIAGGILGHDLLLSLNEKLKRWNWLMLMLTLIFTVGLIAGAVLLITAYRHSNPLIKGPADTSGADNNDDEDDDDELKPLKNSN